MQKKRMRNKELPAQHVCLLVMLNWRKTGDFSYLNEREPQILKRNSCSVTDKNKKAKKYVCMM